MSKLIGYARVSTNDQELHLQIDALVKEGVEAENIFTDKISGAKKERPGLQECLESLEERDTLIVWRLDRLGRSLGNLVQIVEDLREKKIGFRVLSGLGAQINTSTPDGRMMFGIFAALSEFERELIQERTRAGLKAARARGRVGGRKPLNPNDPKIITAREMYKNKSIPIGQICDTLGISKATFYRWVGK
ncbi:recombinase family protein [Pseudomonadota bacterium]